MATGKVIKLTNSSGTPLLPITDSSYVQHIQGTGNNAWITSVQNIISYTYTLAHPADHSHGNITSSGTLSAANMVVITDSSGKITTDTNINSTELSYLNNTRSNIQTQIDNISNAISSGVTFKGVWNTGTLPETASSSTVGHMWTYTGTGTFNLPAVTNGNDAEVLRKGDAIIGVYSGTGSSTTYYWCAIDNNADIATSSTPGLVMSGSGVSAPTMAVDVASDGKMSVTHYTPTADTNSKLSKDASGGSALAANTALQIVTGVDISRDAKGHVTALDLDSKQITIPSIPNGFANVKTDSDETDITENTTKGTIEADTTTDTVTLRGGNKWITTGVNTTNDIAYVNHKTKWSADGSTSANASGASAAWSIDVVKGVTLSYDAAGHVTGLSVTSGKIPGQPNAFTKVKAGTDETDITENTTKTECSADSTTDLVTVIGGNKWITTGSTDTSNNDTLYINHKTKWSADGSTTANASGASAAWSIDVVKGITLSYDAAGHVTGLSVTSGKIPGQPTAPTNDFGKITSTTHKTAYDGGVVNTSTATADTTQDTLNVLGGNYWITTGVVENGTNDYAYVNHALSGAGAKTSNVYKITTDAAGHVSGAIAQSSESITIPGNITLSSYLQYVQGKDVTISDTFLTTALGQSQTTVIPDASLATSQSTHQYWYNVNS